MSSFATCTVMLRNRVHVGRKSFHTIRDVYAWTVSIAPARVAEDADSDVTPLCVRPGAVRPSPPMGRVGRDMRTVLDAVGCERAAIMAWLDGGPMAMLFAATYPERTAALVLAYTAARYVHADDHPHGFAPEVAEHLSIRSRNSGARRGSCRLRAKPQSG